MVVVDTAYKKISSSEAHKRVQTSPLFEGRPMRVAHRMADLKAAMLGGQLQRHGDGGSAVLTG